MTGNGGVTVTEGTNDVTSTTEVTSTTVVTGTAEGYPVGKTREDTANQRKLPSARQCPCRCRA
jgi:hypothetical protein